MTIQNRETSAEYFGILADGHASGRLALIAETTDKAVEALTDICKAAGVTCPGDDRLANIETAIYAMLKAAN
jgi:hypothetical protein